MSYELIVKPWARADMLDAFDWYEEQREGLGSRFLDRVGVALDRIRENPTAYQIIDKKVRARSNIARPFPYLIIFTIEENKVVVHSVVHAKRHRREWKRRL